MPVNDELGQRRHDLHEGHPTHRPLSKGYESVGIAGEISLSGFTGMAPDFTLKAGGDGGIDSHVYLRYSINVHAARKPLNLIHEVGKEMADIIVLADYNETSGLSQCLGWEWGRVLAKAPTREFGKGVLNHYIERGELRSMDELSERMLKL
jgi:hypothetical protein